jgi:hypothetical protein
VLLFSMVHEDPTFVILMSGSVILAICFRVEEFLRNSAFWRALYIPAEVGLFLIEPNISVSEECVSTDPEQGAATEQQRAQNGISLSESRNARPNKQLITK